MNKKLFILTKILLKNGTGAQEKKDKNGKKPIISKNILMLILIGLAFLPLAINIVLMVSFIYDTLVPIGQQGVILSLGITAVSFIMFFFGIFYVINVFYFANDIERLLPLPLKPSQIMTAKFFTVVIYEYLTEAAIMLPILGVYGVKSGAGIAFYLIGLVVFALVPIIPLAISSIIVMIIMRFTNLGRNKDRFKLIGGIAALFIAIGFNVVFQKAAMQSVDPKNLQDMLLAGKNSFVGLIGRMFPGAEFAAISLANASNINGFINLLIFTAIAAIVFFLFVYLGEMLYFKGVVGISEASGSRKVSIDELKRRSIKNSKLNAYVGKELKLLFRTPIYFLNCVVTNFLWPIIFLVMPMTQSSGSDGIDDIDMIKSLVQNSQNAGIILAIAFAATIFIAGSNGITSTSISREGQQLYINKYLPISYITQLHAKVLSGVILSTIGMVVMLITMAVVFKLYASVVILSLISGVAAVFFTSLTGIIIDLFNPKLTWDNEQKAVKQNMNVVFNMLLSIVLAGATGFAAFKLKTDLYTTFALLVLIFGLLDIMLYRFLDQKGVKLFTRIE